jgi:ABC-type phosphate transport system substrate-binding protein
MGRLIKLSRRVLASGAMLAGGSVLAQGLFSSTSAKADDVVCTALPGVTTTIIVSGSSAVMPTVAALGVKLASATTAVVYSKQGSCTGVAAITGTPPATAGTGQYWDTTTTAGAPKTCTMPANTPVDVGVSDVFATSCPGVKGDTLATAKVADFDTFFAQVMEFIVPGGDGGSDQTAISAEAAYLTFGFGNNGGTPWSKQDQFMVRNNTSGTQVMLSKAIGLDASKWIGFDESNEGGAGQIFKDVKNRQIPDPNYPTDATKRLTGDPKTMIGIVSSGEADADPVNVKRLAFQATGQTCAFWADSGVSALDKKYVRDGHYPVWGPLHVLAKVDDAGAPTSAGAKALIAFLSNTDVTDHSVLDVEIGAHVVPLCAMNVTRSSELGALSSVQPTGACGCYFDSTLAASLPTECVACTPANAATKCTGDRKVCNYGFCEVK